MSTVSGPEYDKAYIIKLLRDFYNEEDIEPFLNSPCYQLGYETPQSYIDRGETGPVLTMLQRINEGVYL